MDWIVFAVSAWVVVVLLFVAAGVIGAMQAKYRQRLSQIPAIRAWGWINFLLTAGVAGLTAMFATGVVGISDPSASSALVWFVLAAFALVSASIWIIAVPVDARMAHQRYLLAGNNMPADPHSYGGAVKRPHAVDSDGGIVLSGIGYQPGSRSPQTTLR